MACLLLATLNCLTLCQDSRIVELEEALIKIKCHVIGLAEVRRPNEASMDLAKSGSVLYHTQRLQNRMAGVGFINISNEFTNFSSKGQVPFVEINGRQIADSNLIIDFLREEFGKADMDPTDPKQLSLARAYSALAEEHLTWCMIAIRGKTVFPFLLTDDGWGRYHGTGIRRRIKQFFVRRMIKTLGVNRSNAHGMGRNTLDEIQELAKDDLKAFSDFLGEKPYFGGDKPTSLDASMFGHIAGLVYMPTPNGLLTKHVNETYPNLRAFVERMKERFWPDWEETCATMNMNTHNKKKE